MRRTHNRPGLRPHSERHRFSAPCATISAPRAENCERLQKAGENHPREREMDRNPAKAACILRGECQTFSALRAEIAARGTEIVASGTSMNSTKLCMWHHLGDVLSDDL